MKGPLHPSAYDTATHQQSWWEASAGPAPARAPLDRDLTADVAVIGGGYCGLWAAATLAARGATVAVLEAGEIGWGSSGRNGGIVGFGGDKLSPGKMVRRHGAEEVRRYHAEMVRGVHFLKAFCHAHGLSDWVQDGGELVLAHSARAAKALAAEDWPDGMEVTPVAPSGRDDIAQHGGVRWGDPFGIHPLRLVRAIADHAEAEGAKVFPRSEVIGWDRAQGRHLLTTAGGTVNAAKVLAATNAFAPEGLHDVTTGRAVPVISNIGVTRPLTEEERARHPWLGPDMTGSDTAHLLVYFRLLPDGRFLFGMRGDSFQSPGGEARMRKALRERLDRAFPGWKDAEITHFWRGPVCMTASFTPSVGVLPQDGTVAHAFGWHGSGINLGGLAGRMIGNVLAGDPVETIPAPMRGLAPRLPFPWLRPRYVGMMRGVYAVMDRLS